MKKYNKKILIATGGTGGHIFPSLSLANFLKNQYDVKIITDKRGLRYFNNDEKINIKIIDSGRIYKKNILKSLIGIIKVFSSFFISIILMLISRPTLIIGMGGYSSFPICAAGYFLRIPIVIYENNLVIGKANSILLPYAKNILVSTKSVKGIKKKFEKKIYPCGYLIRNQILKLINEKKINKNTDKLSILIIGGSQSAKIFGETLPSILVKCLNNGMKFKIYQQCLENQIDQISNIYKRNNFEFELFSFSDKLIKYYEAANLAITRSGASSLAELINLRIPFIAVPLPSAADNHQFFNAKYFEEKGYCFLIEEKEVSVKLYETLMDLSKNKKKLFFTQEKMNKHSDSKTLNKIEELIKKIIDE